MDFSWLQVENVADLASPALLVFPERISANIERMLQTVGGDAARLRPHVKTHKMLPLLQMQIASGITRFKCATIAEAELCAEAGAADVLIAYQPVGPNIRRLAELVERYPATSFAVIVDSSETAQTLSDSFQGRPLRTFLDLDVGMHRTGIAPGEKALKLGQQIQSLPGLLFAGLHAYDGHNYQTSLEERAAAYRASMAPVWKMADALAPPTIVAGGSPTFALHAAHSPWECSPGTTLLWDAGYGEQFPDLPYEPAAALLTRVISRPSADRICVDLGYKSVAAENLLSRRVRFPQLSNVEAIGQSEEHLVLSADEAERLPIGAELFAIPIHICPTVALYAEAAVIRGGRATGEIWPVRARDRRLTV